MNTMSLNKNMITDRLLLYADSISAIRNRAQYSHGYCSEDAEDIAAILSSEFNIQFLYIYDARSREFDDIYMNVSSWYSVREAYEIYLPLAQHFMKEYCIHVVPVIEYENTQYVIDVQLIDIDVSFWAIEISEYVELVKKHNPDCELKFQLDTVLEN